MPRTQHPTTAHPWHGFLIALGTGLFFGWGLTLSGMTDPLTVQAFLDVAGEWNPALAFVMGGAVLVSLVGFQWLLQKREAPVCGEVFHLPQSKAIDKRLLGGAALFGMEAAQDWDGYSERSIAASEAGKPAPAKPGNGLGGLGFGLAMLGLVPIGLGFVRMQDRARTSYTLGEGHDAAMHVPAATLPNGELFPLVSGTGDYALQFTAEMQGELTVDGTSVR